MNRKMIAAELLKVARDLTAGDEWVDDNTKAFAKEVASVMKSDRDILGVKVSGNKIKFVHVPNLVVAVPLVLELKEFGYEESESVNGTIFSEKVSNFRIPGGYTRDRNPKELWKKAKDSLEDVIRRTL